MTTRYLLVVALLVLLSSCASQAAQQPAPQTQSPTKTVAPPVAPPKPVMEISIIRYTFSPETVHVSVGDTLRWINQDGTSHNIKLLGNPASPIISPGQTYDLTLQDKGTYAYSCGIHAKMHGTIIVE